MRSLNGIFIRLLLLCGLASGPAVNAQEAFRASLAGQMALDAKKRRITAGWGDIRLGAMKMDLSSQLRIEASDNVLYRENDPKSDFIFSPSMGLRALYPVTDKNLLTLGTGVGYSFYVENGENNYLFLSPDSDLSFDLYAGDFVINFHDRFHYTQEIVSEPSLGGRGTFGRFDNSLGTLVTWDLNKALLQFNYDHLIYVATEDRYKYTDHTSELFGLRSGWLLTPTTPVGLDFGFGMTGYNQNLLDDMNHYSVGAFYEVPAGQYVKLKLAAGYVYYETTSNNNTNLNAGNTSAVYADLTFEHRISRHITYTVSGGQQVIPGYNGQLLQYYFARGAVNWNIIRGYGLSTWLQYENGEEAGRYYGLGYTTEQFDRYYLGVSITKRLSEKLYSSFGYTFLQRNSVVPGWGYTQNRLVLTVAYSF